MTEIGHGSIKVHFANFSATLNVCRLCSISRTCVKCSATVLKLMIKFVQVHQRGLPFEPRQYDVNGFMEGRRAILQYKRDLAEAEKTGTGRKSSFIFVCFGIFDQPISAVTVKFDKYGCEAKRTNSIVHARYKR